MDKGLTLGRRRMKSRKHTNDLLLLSIFSIVVFLITFKLLGADQPASHLSITFFQFLSFPSLPSSGNVTKFTFFISIYEAKVMILDQTVINQL